MRRFALMAVLALAACTDGLAPTAPTGEPSLARAGRGGADGDYIVVFKPSVGDVAAESQRLTNKHRAELKREYRAALRGMAVRMSAAEVAALQADPAVDYVEADGVMYTMATQSGATWGIDRVDQRALPLSGTYTYNADGSGVTVYIIDTGIRFAHNEFGGRATGGFDAVTPGGSAADCNGHGTHVAGTVGGTVYGVAKKVDLVAVRVLNCSGSGSFSGVIAGIDWVTSNRQLPAVANMSLGGSFSSAVNQAVQNSIAAGVTYAVAAGNSSTNACNSSPASAPNALTVGATTNTDAFASYSNRGSCVDINAPGSGITSAWYTSNTAAATISGTSMASPHVAGTAALYLSGNTSASPATVGGALTSNATTGTITGLPSGTTDQLLYSGFIGGGNPPPPPPPPAVNASFTYSCSGLTCSFNASGSTGATSYAWTFGDGTNGSGVTVSHKFAARKEYTVVLTATGSSGSDTASAMISCNRVRCR